MGKTLDVVITGYPSLDYIFQVNLSPNIGETAIILNAPDINDFKEATLGGCPCNIAVASARLDLKVGVILVLGNDRVGKLCYKTLRKEGVDTRGVSIIKDGYSPYSFLFFNPYGKHQTFYYPGVSDYKDVPLRLNEELLQGLHLGVITVGNPIHIKAVAEFFAKFSIPLLWSLKGDPHAYPKSLVERLIDLSEIIVMNEDEANLLKKVLSLPTVRKLLVLLLHRGTKAVILTMGKRGSRVFTINDDIYIPAVPPKVFVDPTGAGDAFVAGLLFGLFHELPIHVSARVGAVVSSFVLEARGCQTNLPKLSEVLGRYKIAFGEELLWS